MTHSDPSFPPELLLVSNDPPGIRCNRNLAAALEIANRFKVTIRLLPRSTAGADARAPAVYVGGKVITAHGDARNGVADAALLATALEQAGVPRQDKPGRLAEIDPAVAAFTAAIGEVPK
ncbi:MAG: hypothetical protein AB1450_07620 [Pseudomonadota bacterium]